MNTYNNEISDIMAFIESKGHNSFNKPNTELYFKFLFENEFSNSKLLLEVFQRDFFEITIEIIDEEKLEVVWKDVDNTLTKCNETLIILLLSHDEEDIRRGNRSPEKLAIYDGLLYYAEKTIPNFKGIFELIVKHKK